ncbi:MAG: hypothetical protein ABW217_10660, partial [Polyangiaceae bacterium]
SSLQTSNTGPRRSRAASFALRSALVAGAASAAVACGGSGDIPRPEPNQGGSSAANGGSGGSGGTDNAAGTGGTASNGGSAGSGTIDLADAGDTPEEEDAGAYVPIPIYGGAFPDPMTRARV